MLDSSLYLTTGPQGLKGGVGGIYSFDSAPNTSSPRGMFCLSEDDQAIRLYCTHILPGRVPPASTPASSMNEPPVYPALKYYLSLLQQTTLEL